MITDICFATNNQGKLSEIQSLLNGNINVKSLKDIGFAGDLPENQLTLEGNAEEKATAVWNNYRMPCFSDDTGLEISALNGEPGVFSARYAGPLCNPEDNIDLVLKNLVNSKDRSARFRTVICLIQEGKKYFFEGSVEGNIAMVKTGQKGFGYDPIFIPKGYGKTFAEFTMEEKNAISHRGQAVKKLVEFLLHNND